MARIIVCECGTVVRGADEQELLRGARVHMETNHPAIAEEITDGQLLALSHEDAATSVGPAPGRVARRNAR
jgi:predicted small metal-binding protein